MELSVVVVGVIVVIWTIGLIVGVSYLRGGGEAVRRLAPRLAIILPIFVVVVVAEAVIVKDAGTRALDLVILPVVAFTLVLQIRRYRRVRRTAPDDPTASTAFTPQIRMFVIIAIAVLVIGLILVSFLAARAGL